MLILLFHTSLSTNILLHPMAWLSWYHSTSIFVSLAVWDCYGFCWIFSLLAANFVLLCTWILNYLLRTKNSQMSRGKKSRYKCHLTSPRFSSLWDLGPWILIVLVALWCLQACAVAISYCFSLISVGVFTFCKLFLHSPRVSL